MWTTLRSLAVGVLIAGAAAASAADEAGKLLALVKAVGTKGAGNPEAAKACKALSRLGPDSLPAILGAMEDDDPIAANWLRAAAESVADKAMKSKEALPDAKLRAFIVDRKHSGVGRRAAYELLARVDAKGAATLLPGMLDDPSPDLRREAVADLLEQAKGLKDEKAAVAIYRKAIRSALDADQVETAATALKKAGETVDLATHFGFITQWRLAGPFDNPGAKNFDTPLPPEKAVDPSAKYEGKKGATLHWVGYASDDPYGKVDLNKQVAADKEVIAYAYAEVESPVERKVELRAGCINGLKMFLNGKQVFACEEYHHGDDMDQYVAPVTLKAGRNELLLKVCQNEKKMPWEKDWSFQVRICDAAGAAVPVKQKPVKVEPKN